MTFNAVEEIPWRAAGIFTNGWGCSFRTMIDATPPPRARRALDVVAGWARKIGVLSRVLGPDYARRLAFRASLEQVFKAIATVEGLQGLWTTLVTGSGSPGGELRFEFEGLKEHINMRVEEATSPCSARWTCVERTELDDWGGTQVTFDIGPRGAEGCELASDTWGSGPASTATRCARTAGNIS
jgi:hypothetical protein